VELIEHWRYLRQTRHRQWFARMVGRRGHFYCTL